MSDDTAMAAEAPSSGGMLDLNNAESLISDGLDAVTVGCRLPVRMGNSEVRKKGPARFPDLPKIINSSFCCR